MSRTAWFHCFSGVAGDMALGALVDAGAPVDELRDLLDRLPVPGWELDLIETTRGGIGATQAVVQVRDTAVVRTAAHIRGLIEEARLPDRIRDRSLATVSALADAEGRLHRHSPSQVHLHEVGGVDAIVDIVGTAAALELLDVEQVLCSPIANGMGMIRSAHGLLPNPAPAVVTLLEGAPTYGLNLSVELTTPTGAALMATLASGWGPLPDMTLTSTGFGAGSRELRERPNLVQAVVGTASGTPSFASPAPPVTLLETNLDDVTGETLADAIVGLLDAGAHDAWVTPVVMKKGRPGHVLAALCDVSQVDDLATVMARVTGTFGIRTQSLGRWAAARSVEEVEVEGRPLRVKVGPGRSKVEHDDALRVAADAGRTVREVTSLAEEAARRQRTDPSAAGRSTGPAPTEDPARPGDDGDEPA